MPSKFGVVAQTSRCAELVSRLLCVENLAKNVADISYYELAHESTSMLEYVIHGVTELCSSQYQGPYEMTDRLEVFSDANVLCRDQLVRQEHYTADGLDFLPDADDVKFRDTSRRMPADMRVKSLALCNASFQWNEIDPNSLVR